MSGAPLVDAASAESVLRLRHPVTGRPVSCVCGTCERCKHRERTRRLRQQGPLDRSPSTRWWANVQKSDSCWIWTGAKSRGYGVIGVDGKHVKAHRFGYELLVGPIPEGLQIDHLCRNPPCVNPAHLEPVTPYENILRGETRWGVPKRLGRCLRGHPWPENASSVRADGSRYCKACVSEKRRSGIGVRTHGTAAGYGRGCRCEPCREARRLWRIEQRDKKLRGLVA